MLAWLAKARRWLTGRHGVSASGEPKVEWGPCCFCGQIISDQQHDLRRVVVSTKDDLWQVWCSHAACVSERVRNETNPALVGVNCCLCGLPVVEQGPDPCRVSVGNGDGSEVVAVCHGACFKRQITTRADIDLSPAHF